MENLKLINYLINHVQERPKSLFLTKVETGETYSYETLYETVMSYFHHLSEKSLKKGDTVLYFAHNDWFIFPLIISFSLLDLTLVPISPDLHKDDLSRIVNDVSPKLVIGDRENASTHIAGIPFLNIAKIDKKEGKIPTKRLNQSPGGDPLLIIYTSGSSGQCKGVIISENNIIHAANSIRNFYKINYEDRFLCILPLYHMNAIMVTGMVPFLAGASIALSDTFSFMNAPLYFKRVEIYKPSILSLIPSVMSVLIKTENKMDLSAKGIKLCFCGAAPLSAGLWKQFEKKFNIGVYQGYGLTETTFWATLTPTDDTKDYDSVGIPHNCDIKIKKEMGEKAGEILISGPFVTKGYLNRNEGFDEDDYFKTGDLGYIGANHQLYILGRIKDVIIRNGINVYPQSIDSILTKCPGVEDCASIGIEHEIMGEQIYTICVPSIGIHIEEKNVKRYARENLSSYMLPDKIIFFPKLPRGATGKIIKKELLDAVEKVEREKAIKKSKII